MNVFFYSDPHFGHGNIIKYCDRPYYDIEQMNYDLVQKYNYLVNLEDTVYFLGDIGFSDRKSCKELLSHLNGNKILILGNHDKWGVNAYYNMGFKAVLQEATIRIGKNWVTMAHYPNRNLLSFLKIFWFYIKKMKERKRSWKQIFQKIKKEWRWSSLSSKIWHLHGHVHNKWKVAGRNINCCVDVWDFKPVSIKDIAKVIDGQTRKT